MRSRATVAWPHRQAAGPWGHRQAADRDAAGGKGGRRQVGQDRPQCRQRRCSQDRSCQTCCSQARPIGYAYRGLTELVIGEGAAVVAAAFLRGVARSTFIRSAGNSSERSRRPAGGSRSGRVECHQAIELGLGARRVFGLVDTRDDPVLHGEPAVDDHRARVAAAPGEEQGLDRVDHLVLVRQAQVEGPRSAPPRPRSGRDPGGPAHRPRPASPCRNSPRRGRPRHRPPSPGTGDPDLHAGDQVRRGGVGAEAHPDAEIAIALKLASASPKRAATSGQWTTTEPWSRIRARSSPGPGLWRDGVTCVPCGSSV